MINNTHYSFMIVNFAGFVDICANLPIDKKSCSPFIFAFHKDDIVYRYISMYSSASFQGLPRSWNSSLGSHIDSVPDTRTNECCVSSMQQLLRPGQIFERVTNFDQCHPVVYARCYAICRSSVVVPAGCPISVREGMLV